ncbi:hypothetical protein [Abyssalbus ytuae]|uniref:Uncharacterized protein n=1 Tax=Abyssalbus ytuae TaxID=2926907 RepID=A0A9E6ZK80_9FLAO|nr:hypothetical protein [Abyssalbus ytuae]UOB16054.1 hypothetical protein MQE35_09915 [Abyssalbus ytuae]
MLNNSNLNYLIIFVPTAVTLVLKNSAEYFFSGRTMPWWLIGISANTPHLETNLE